MISTLRQASQPTHKASTHLTSGLRKFTALPNTHGLISTHGAIVFLARRQNRTFMCSRTASRLRQSAQTTHKASTHLTSRLLKVTALAYLHGLISTHHFLARRQKGPSFAVARLLDCDSRPNPRTQPQHTCLHVCARLQQPWRTHTASPRQRGASLRKMRPLTFNNKATDLLFPGPRPIGTTRLSPRLRQSLPLLPSRAWGNKGPKKTDSLPLRSAFSPPTCLLR